MILVYNVLTVESPFLHIV